LLTILTDERRIEKRGNDAPLFTVHNLLTGHANSFALFNFGGRPRPARASPGKMACRCKHLIYLSTMKYVSIFATIVLIWVAIILMATTRSDAKEIFELYITAIISTFILFVIGFRKR
jgi:hypothetical protein